MTVTLGFKPASLVVPLTKDADFVATITTQDGSDFADGAAVTLELTKAHSDPILWAATIDGDTARWDVDKTDVNALVPGTVYTARVLYSDTAGNDLVWFSGQTTWNSRNGGGTSFAVATPVGSVVVVVPVPGPPGTGGTSGVSSFNTRTGAVTLTKGDVTGTGLAAADVGADASGAAAAAQAAAIAAAAADATAKANAAGAAAIASADSYTDGKIAAEVTRADAAYDALGAAAAAQAAAIAASQPLDSDLTAIAALTTTAFGRSLLTQADAAALRSTAGLGSAATHAATDFDSSGAAAAAQAASQPLDSDLTAIAALTTTTFGRSFLTLADAAASRTLLGLGTLATQSGTFSGTSSGTNTGDQTITLTGDVTGSGTGSFAATLKNTGTAGTYGDATHTLTVTTDAQGRVTSVTANAISVPNNAADNLYLAANYR